MGERPPHRSASSCAGARVVHVLARPRPRRLAARRRAGAADRAGPAGLRDNLAQQVTRHGYSLEHGDRSGANGYTDPARRVVKVRGDVDAAQAVKTLAHALGHLECGHVEDLPTYLTCRGRCEIEAESVAYVVAAAHGLDASGYTFAYVAGWPGETCPASGRPPRPSRRPPGRSSPAAATRTPLSDDLADAA